MLRCVLVIGKGGGWVVVAYVTNVKISILLQ